MSQRYRIAVLFGSRSPEHEVSVVSALQVISFLKARHEIIPIYITKSGEWFTGPHLGDVKSYKNFDYADSRLQPVAICPDPQLQLVINPLGKGMWKKPEKVMIDVVFPVLHGAHGEDGTIQGLLDLANLPYVGSGVLGSCIGIDKIITKAVLKENRLPVVDYLWFTRSEWKRGDQGIISQIQERFPFPVVIKPASLGSTIGISKAENSEDLRFGIDEAIHYDDRVIIEQYVNNHLEINCSVMGYEDFVASTCEQPISRESLLSFNDKYIHADEGTKTGMAGATRVIPAPITSELTTTIQDLAVRAFRSIGGSGVARIDFLIDGDTQTVYINEINTLPGSIAFYLWKAGGLAPEQLVDKLIQLAFERHQEKQKTRYTFDSPLLQQTNLLGIKKGT